MRPALAFVALAAWSAADARGQSALAKSARGGLVAATGHYRFEVFFYRSGMRVFPAENAGSPLDVSRLSGTATFYHPNSSRPWFARPLRPVPSAGSLDLAIGLRDAPPAGGTVTVDITGLPQPAEPAATLSVPLDFVAEPARGNPTLSARPAQRYAERRPAPLGYPGSGYGLGYRRDTWLSPAVPPASRPPGSLSGYGRLPTASGGTSIPYVSGHGAFILPSGR